MRTEYYRGRVPVLAMALALILTFFCRPAAAFKEAGHRAIERLAYERMIAANEKEVLIKLVRAGALRRLPPNPYTRRMLRNSPGGERYIGLPEGDLNVDGIWVGSHIPDHSFERQLQSYGQCFHFNAGADDVTGPDIHGMPRGLVVDAYLRCVSLLDILIRGVIYDPPGSQQRQLGLYTLIHILTDSFSEAHVARSEDWRVLYVRPWRLRSWIRYLFEPRAWKHHVSDDHHAVLDPRDYEYALELPQCQELRDDAARLYESCFSERALRAAEAVAALLRLVSGFVDCRKGAATGPLTCPGFEQKWNDFKREHLHHALEGYTAHLTDAELQKGTYSADLIGPSDLIRESGAKPIGVGLAFDLSNHLHSETESIWLTADTFYLRDAMQAEDLGLSDYFTYGLQLRVPLETGDGQRPLGIAGEWGVRVPGNLLPTNFIALHLGVRLLRTAYGVSRVSPQLTRHTFEIGFGGVSVDVVFLQRLWVGVQAPRAVRRADTFGPDQWNSFWTIKAGVALDEP